MKKQAAQPALGGRQINEIENSQNNKKKTLLIILIIILILIISLVSFIIYSLSRKEDRKQEGFYQKRDTVVTIDNKDQILADLNNKIAEGLYEVTMNVDWSFENSSIPSENAYVANAATNSNTVYFDVTLDSNGETIYESPYIPVGSALKNIALKSELPAGTYPCTVVYHLIDDSSNEISKVAVAVTVKVLN